MRKRIRKDEIIKFIIENGNERVSRKRRRKIKTRREKGREEVVGECEGGKQANG